MDSCLFGRRGCFFGGEFLLGVEWGGSRVRVSFVLRGTAFAVFLGSSLVLSSLLFSFPFAFFFFVRLDY